ncbi:MAG: hypothetical protein UT55_C0043G0003 [Candidatus Peregrinibacteria bacterium GW2011_GWE2_39_6]|nr:MAG: hypothetical protein UT55_C0043G0003 [Candidatus Peregrinibacteria bacterium GW2011_GWE2_39_6]
MFFAYAILWLINLLISITVRTLFRLTRSGAEAARQAHNLEVGGSNPPSATNFNVVAG